MITCLGRVFSRGLPGSCSCTFGCTFQGFRTFCMCFRLPFHQNWFLFSHEVESRSYKMNIGLMSCLFWASYNLDNLYFVKLGYDLVIRWPILISIWVFRLVTLQRYYKWIDTCQIRKDIFIIKPFWGQSKSMYDSCPLLSICCIASLCWCRCMLSNTEMQKLVYWE